MLCSCPAAQFAHPNIMKMTSQERKCIQMCLKGPPGKFQLTCCFRTVLNTLNEIKAGHLLSSDKIIWSVITWDWSHATYASHISQHVVGQEGSKKLDSTGERMMRSREEVEREQPRNKWCKTPALWLEPEFRGQARCDLTETLFYKFKHFKNVNGDKDSHICLIGLNRVWITCHIYKVKINLHSIFL